jgi:hypothetical protein
MLEQMGRTLGIIFGSKTRGPKSKVKLLS